MDKKLIRGVPLVEEVIHVLKNDPSNELNQIIGKPKPVSNQKLEKIKQSNGAPFSPSVIKWLEYDASWCSQIFKPLSFLKLMEEEFGEDETRDDIIRYWKKRSKKPFTYDELDAAEYKNEFGELEPFAPSVIVFNLLALTGSCFLFGDGCESRRFIYAGKPDTYGEYPVLVVDIDNNPFVTIEAPGFDVYLAQMAGIIEYPKYYGANFDNPVVKTDMETQARLNLHGFRQIGEWDDGIHLDGKGKNVEIYRKLIEDCSPKKE